VSTILSSGEFIATKEWSISMRTPRLLRSCHTRDEQTHSTRSVASAECFRCNAYRVSAKPECSHPKIRITSPPKMQPILFRSMPCHLPESCLCFSERNSSLVDRIKLLSARSVWQVSLRSGRCLWMKCTTRAPAWHGIVHVVCLAPRKWIRLPELIGLLLASCRKQTSEKSFSTNPGDWFPVVSGNKSMTSCFCCTHYAIESNDFHCSHSRLKRSHPRPCSCPLELVLLTASLRDRSLSHLAISPSSLYIPRSTFMVIILTAEHAVRGTPGWCDSVNPRFAIGTRRG
jgi:hypothetical protein